MAEQEYGAEWIKAEVARLHAKIDALEAEIDLLKAWSMAAVEIHPDLLDVFHRLTEEAKHISTQP